MLLIKSQNCHNAKSYCCDKQTLLFIPYTGKDCCRSSLKCISKQGWHCLNLMMITYLLQGTTKIKLLMSDLATIFFM